MMRYNQYFVQCLPFNTEQFYSVIEVYGGLLYRVTGQQFKTQLPIRFSPVSEMPYNINKYMQKSPTPETKIHLPGRELNSNSLIALEAHALISRPLWPLKFVELVKSWIGNFCFFIVLFLHTHISPLGFLLCRGCHMPCIHSQIHAQTRPDPKQSLAQAKV